MKQRQYNAFEIEFKSHTLDKEEFLNMDETIRQTIWIS